MHVLKRPESRIRLHGEWRQQCRSTVSAVLLKCHRRTPMHADFAELSSMIAIPGDILIEKEQFIRCNGNPAVMIDSYSRNPIGAYILSFWRFPGELLILISELKWTSLLNFLLLFCSRQVTIQTQAYELESRQSILKLINLPSQAGKESFYSRFNWWIPSHHFSSLGSWHNGEAPEYFQMTQWNQSGKDASWFPYKLRICAQFKIKVSSHKKLLQTKIQTE